MQAQPARERVARGRLRAVVDVGGPGAVRRGVLVPDAGLPTVGLPGVGGRREGEHEQHGDGD